MQGARAVWVAVGILALAFLVGVLAPAWYFAGRLVENNTAVRAIGELQQQPSRMQAALNSIQDRLRARGFVRDSIEQLKRATVQFDGETKKLMSGDESVAIGGFGSDDDVQKTIKEMTAAWKKYKPALDPVANFTAIPYSDSEREGTQLNMDGRELQRQVTNAVTQSRAYTPALEKNLVQIITGLQSSSDSLATALRSVVLIGVGLAGRAGRTGRLPLTGPWQAGRRGHRRPPADGRHPLDRARRSVPARRRSQDRHHSLGRDRAAVPARVGRRHHLRRPVARPGDREDARHRHQVRQGAVERAHQGKPDPLDQSAQRSGAAGRREGQQGRRDPLPRIQLPPRAPRRRDHARAGVRGRRHRTRRAGGAAQGCAGQCAAPDGRVPFDPARGSGAAVVVPGRFGRRVQDDQRHAA